MLWASSVIQGVSNQLHHQPMRMQRTEDDTPVLESEKCIFRLAITCSRLGSVLLQILADLVNAILGVIVRVRFSLFRFLSFALVLRSILKRCILRSHSVI